MFFSSDSHTRTKTLNRMMLNPNIFNFNDLIKYIKKHDITITKSIYSELILYKLFRNKSNKEVKTKLNNIFNKNNISKSYYIKIIFLSNNI